MAHVGLGRFIFYSVPFLLLGHHFTAIAVAPGTLTKRGRTALHYAYLILLITTLAAAGLMVGRIVWHTFLVPPATDFQGLWVYGRIVDAGQNPYLPSSYPAFAPPPYVDDFQDVVLNVGAVYPPPSLLMFATVGWLPMREAIVPWMIIQIAAFVMMIVLLRRTFFPGDGWQEWAFVLTLALLLSSTISTFGQAQISFIAVLFVLFAWRARDRAASGAYLVIGSVVKLLYGFLWLYPLLRRQWKALKGIVVAGSVTLLVTLAALGWKIFASYVFDNPVSHRLPSRFFMAAQNQSLLGACLRLIPYNRPRFGPPIGHPAYLVSAAFVGLITVWAVVRQPRTREGEDTAFVLILLAGMLIYPWTLSNYFVVLLVPMGFLWLRRAELPLGVGWTIALLSLVYPLTYYGNARYSILATALLWLATCAIALHVIRTSSVAEKQDQMRPAFSSE